VTHRKTVVYAELQANQDKEVYDRWLENEGVLLADKIAEKKRLSKEYSAKVYFLCYFIECFILIIFLSYIPFLIRNRLIGLHL
jgi:hypothetical protein